MAEYFDSPRASKRRKTTTYGADRSILKEGKDDVFQNRTPTGATGSARSKRQRDKFTNNMINGLNEDESIEHEIAPVPGAESKATHDADVRKPRGMTATVRAGRGVKRQSRGGRSSNIERSPSVQKSERKEAAEDMAETSKEAVNTDRQGTPPTTIAESEEETAGDGEVALQPRSSGRERKRPRRFSISPQKPKAEAMIIKEPSSKLQTKTTSSRKEEAKAPKGILTPSRREKKGPRKSVVFDRSEKDLEEQLGFKDIDSSTKTSAKKTPRVVAGSPSKVLHKSKKFHSTAPSEEPPSDDIIMTEAEDTTDNQEDDLFIDDLVKNHQTDFEGPDLELVPSSLRPAEEDPSVLAIKSAVLTRLITPSSLSSTQTTLIPSHLQSQYTTIHNLLTATITAGESNSLLLLGSRGSGKSHLLTRALSDLTAKHGSDFHTVHLNGYFQTDDKLALRETWRQLGREMNTDEDEADGTAGSYADTMASLLSLLSHPDEFLPAPGDEEEGHGVKDQADESAEDPTRIASRSVIFVLDEFDLFTTHPRQTLLYNLFDIAQSRKAPIAVIGCSTRMDVVDCLEKRVKSRFSHRWVHVPTVRSLDGFQDIVRDALCLSLDEDVMSNTKEQREKLQARSRWNEFIKSTFLPSAAIQNLVKQVFYSTKSVPDLFTALYIPIATLQLPASGSEAGAAGSSLVLTAPSALPQPSPLALLTKVPTLHLALLIAAARLDIIHSLTAVNFNLVYSHYAELVTRSKLQQTASGAVAVGAGLRQWSRETARAAWEDLGSWAFVIPVSSGAKENGGELTGGEGASVRMWRVDVTLDDLSWAVRQKRVHGGGVVEVLAKWCREV